MEVVAECTGNIGTETKKQGLPQGEQPAGGKEIPAQGKKAIHTRIHKDLPPVSR